MGLSCQSSADHPRLLQALAAAAVLVLLVVLIAIGLAKPPAAAPAVSPGAGDVALYNRIVTHVRGGESYYPAAIREAREHNYPVRPFFTVRLPTLAWFLAAWPSDLAGRISLMILAAVTLVAWARRLARLQMPALRYGFALLCLTSGIVPAFMPMALPMHEVWAGLLIALSMTLRRPNRWVAAVAIGTLAALTRELAVAYLLAMLAIALKERRFGEAAGWISGIAVFALAMTVHAGQVHQLVTAADPASQGWLQAGGWHFVLDTAQWNLLLSAAPNWVKAVVLPLALLGLTASPVDQRLLLTVAGYTAAFTLVGRADNFYWGLLIAPLWPIGLASAPTALAQHIASIRALLITKRDLEPSDAGA